MCVSQAIFTLSTCLPLPTGNSDGARTKNLPHAGSSPQSAFANKQPPRLQRMYTMTVALSHGKSLIIGHMGDSAYLLTTKSSKITAIILLPNACWRRASSCNDQLLDQ